LCDENCRWTVGRHTVRGCRGNRDDERAGRRNRPIFETDSQLPITLRLVAFGLLPQAGFVS
jgi:hypothetical protein